MNAGGGHMTSGHRTRTHSIGSRGKDTCEKTWQEKKIIIGLVLWRLEFTFLHLLPVPNCRSSYWNSKTFLASKWVLRKSFFENCKEKNILVKFIFRIEKEQEFIANNKRTIWMGSPSLHPRQFTNLNFGESAIFTMSISIKVSYERFKSDHVLIDTRAPFHGWSDEFKTKMINW